MFQKKKTQKHSSPGEQHAKKVRTISLLVLALVAVLLYGNTLDNGFIYDDQAQVQDNTYVHELKYLPKVITACIWESELGDCTESSYYRPTQSLSYLLTYQISPQPWVFHLASLLYFIGNILLVYLLVSLLSKNSKLAFVSALLFTIHPLNTEAVNWIAAVPELLSTLFSLLALIYYIRYRESKETKKLILLSVWYGLAIASKESAVLLPIVFLALDVVYFRNKIKELISWKHSKPYVVLFGIFLGYLIMRFSILGGLGTDPGATFTIADRLYSFFIIFVYYVQKLLWPVPLVFFLSFDPVYELFSIKFISAIGIFFLLLGVSIVAFRKKWSLLFVSLVWFFIFLLPGMLFLNTSVPLAERYGFAPAIGFSIIVALVLHHVWERNKVGKTLVIAVLALAFVSSFLVIYQRNRIWHDNEILYRDTLTNSPDSDTVRYNLAKIFVENGDVIQAKEEYEIVISRGVFEDLYKAYNNLGNIYRSEGRYIEALDYFEKSLEINTSSNKETYNNIGVAYAEQYQIANALQYFCKAIIQDQNYAVAGANYDQATVEIKKLDESAFSILYEEITHGGEFQPSLNNNITLEKVDCSSPPLCRFTFLSEIQAGEFLMPGIMMGMTEHGAVLKPLNTSFDQETNRITLNVLQTFQPGESNFIFPKCDGTYYQVQVPNEPFE